MHEERFQLTADQADALAREFGTPLYVLSEAGFRSRLARYREAFLQAAPGGQLSYASKANSIFEVLRIAHSEGYHIDVASEGEARAAILAGVPPVDLHFHGNGKSESELRFALEQGVGRIMVDHFGELEWLGENMSPGHRDRTGLMLRLAPGVDPKTHQAISTGQADTKFGFNIGDGSAARAVAKALAYGLPLKGFHCHVGSQLLDPEAQRAGGQQIARFADEIYRDTGFAAAWLNVGGGLGVRYVDEQQPMAVEEYCQLVTNAVRDALEGTGLQPLLAQEPGRSVIAEAGVTVYRVLVDKTVPTAHGQRRYLVVDGGLSDNPRPVMYGAGHDVYVAGLEGELECVTIAGKHCETDTLLADVEVPGGVAVGDLLQVLCTGAYNASMASNYNRFLRPACVLLMESGEVRLIQRRETWEDLFARDQ